MKKFVSPEMEMVQLNVADIITTSEPGGGADENFGGGGKMD